MKKITNLKAAGDVIVEKPREKRGVIRYLAAVEGSKSGILDIITPDLGLVTGDGEVEPWLRFDTLHTFPVFLEDAKPRRSLQKYNAKEQCNKVSVLLGEYDSEKMVFHAHVLAKESPHLLIMVIGGKLREDLGELFIEVSGNIQFLITQSDSALAGQIVLSIQKYDEKQNERLAALVQELKKNSRLQKNQDLIQEEKDLLLYLAEKGKELGEAKPNYPLDIEVEQDYFVINGTRYFYSVDDMKYLNVIAEILREDLKRLVPHALNQRYNQIRTNVAYLKPYVDSSTDFAGYKKKTKFIAASLCGADVE